MYGGALAAQLVAAARAATAGASQTSCVEVRFLQPADGGLRADFRVERVQDGRSSAVRQVTVTQQGRTVAIGTVGFHTPRDGWVHGGRPAGVHPDSLPMTGTPHRSRAVTADAFDIRYHDEKRDSGIVRHLWFRTVDPLPANASVHECVVMFLSDIYFSSRYVWNTVSSATTGRSGTPRPSMLCGFTVRRGRTIGAGWISTGELDARSDSLGAGLVKVGIGPGDRVASVLTNRAEAVEITFACAKRLRLRPQSSCGLSATSSIQRDIGTTDPDRITHTMRLSRKAAGAVLIDWLTSAVGGPRRARDLRSVP